jgi:hypothetical protein
MPNWCYNRLTVEGPAAYQRAFLGAVEGQESMLQTLYPVAEPNDWYDWCCANWGTKWPESDCDGPIGDVTDEGSIEFTFSTAWAPPIAGFAYISGMFPALTFTIAYDEPGMCFLGAAMMRQGEVIAESEPDYPDMETDEDDYSDEDYETWREKVYETLDEAVSECYAYAASVPTQRETAGV